MNNLPERRTEIFIPLKQRILYIVLPWPLVALVMFPVSLYKPLLFPAGILTLAGWYHERDEYSWRIWAAWSAYLILMGTTAILCRRRLTYFFVYSIFCLLLIFNIAGCRELAANAR